jgi:hypothetical protein
MIKLKQKLKKSDQIEIIDILNTIADVYNDFYLTIDRQRIFIKNNPQTLFFRLTKGDKIIFNKYGLAVITGFSDRRFRKYIKILANSSDAKKLAQVALWNVECDLFAKLKKNNPLVNTLLALGFNVFKFRGNELLLRRKFYVNDKYKK